MFSFLKPDPIKKLRKHYHARLEQAMHAQRNGDIETYSTLATEADEIQKQIQALESSQQKASY